MTDADLPQIQQAALRLNARSEVRDVRLLKSSIELHQFPSGSARLSYDLDSTPEVQYTQDDDFFVVQVSYKLVIEETTDEDSEKAEDENAQVAAMDFVLAALFELSLRENDPPPSEAELEAYSLTTGQLMLYPYVREYIHNTTGRLAIPTLTVGLLKISTKPDS